MESFEQLMLNHIGFTLETFPDATVLSSLAKARGEIAEVCHAILEGGREQIAEEYADVIMCLLDSAVRIGINPVDIKRAFAAKVTKNKSRSWVKNPDNTYSHVKP